MDTEEGKVIMGISEYKEDYALGGKCLIIDGTLHGLSRGQPDIILVFADNYFSPSDTNVGYPLSWLTN